MRCAQLAPVLRTIGTILGIIRRRPLQRAALLGRSGGHGRGGKNGDTSADNDRIELYYAPSVGRGGCRLLDVLQLLAGAAGNLKNREAGNPTDNLQACRPAAQLDNAEASGRPRIDPYCSSHRAADAHSLCPRYPTGSPRRLAEAIAKPNQAVPSRREEGTRPRMTRGYVSLWSASGSKVPQTRAISHRASENAATAGLRGGAGEIRNHVVARSYAFSTTTVSFNIWHSVSSAHSGVVSQYCLEAGR